MHIFAISGLHIALIAGMLLALFRLCALSRGWCGWVIIPLIWFYTAATEWQASAIRSTVMMTVIIAGWSLRRPSDLLNSLAAAGLAILIWDPRQLFQASFQLSFFVVLSLALFAPPLEAWRRRVFALDPTGEPPPPRRAGLAWFRWQVLGLDPWRVPEARPAWQRALHWGLDRLVAALATSLAAALGSTPLIAYYFHLCTPVSLLANLVVVPLSGLALMAGLGSLLTTPWCPLAAEWFNHSGWFWMKLMVLASEASVSWPGSYWYVCEPSRVTLALSYTALVAVLGGWFAGRFRGWAAGAAGLLGAAWVVLAWQDRTITRLTVLPLNGGHAVFVNPPGGRDQLLVDCGDASSVDFVTKPFLRSKGVNRVAQLLLTHGDTRHVGGAPGLFTNFVVERVLAPARSFRSAPYRQALAAWTNQQHRVLSVARNDHLARWRVLHPETSDRSSQADDDAAVLRGEVAGVSVLLCADLGARGQDLLVRREPELRADIVVSGLPSRGQPLLDGLLDRLQPRLIIIADSQYPAAARATEEIRFRLARRKVPVVFTRDTGAVTLELRRGRWRAYGPEGEEVL